MFKRIFVLPAAAVLLVGCATIVKGTTQVVAVTTPGVQGATCTLTSPAIGNKTVVTPGTIELDKSSENVTVSCKKQCYQDGTGIIASSTEAMAAGNVIAGGLIGLGVDAASGAMNRYTPETQIAMAPIAGCKAKA